MTRAHSRPLFFVQRKTFPLILCVRQKHPFSRSIEINDCTIPGIKDPPPRRLAPSPPRYSDYLSAASAQRHRPAHESNMHMTFGSFFSICRKKIRNLPKFPWIRCPLMCLTRSLHLILRNRTSEVPTIFVSGLFPRWWYKIPGNRYKPLNILCIPQDQVQ